jgi:hypothetical protein
VRLPAVDSPQARPDYPDSVVTALVRRSRGVEEIRADRRDPSEGTASNTISAPLMTAQGQLRQPVPISVPAPAV